MRSFEQNITSWRLWTAQRSVLNVGLGGVCSGWKVNSEKPVNAPVLLVRLRFPRSGRANNGRTHRTGMIEINQSDVYKEFARTLVDIDEGLLHEGCAMILLIG